MARAPGTPINERVAVVENKLDQLHDRLADHEKHVNSKLDQILDGQQELAGFLVLLWARDDHRLGLGHEVGPGGHHRRGVGDRNRVTHDCFPFDCDIC